MKEKKGMFHYLTEAEKQLMDRYEKMSDEELFDILRKEAEKLGKIPTKMDIEGAFYFKHRFGPWPRVLEQAGVKPISKRKLRQEQENYQKKNGGKKVKNQTQAVPHSKEGDK